MTRKEFEARLGLPLPDNFEQYDDIIQELILRYLEQLDRIERKAYTIGKSHLGSSFNVVKSNGFIEWRQKLGV
jgi:hypothetical protein